MTRSAEPNYIVIRPHRDLPAGFMPPDLDGRWFDLATMTSGFNYAALGYPQAVAVPSGQFEYRSDGAVAEVWEVKP